MLWIWPTIDTRGIFFGCLDRCRRRVQLRDAWIFPAIVGTAVAVSTMMLLAVGDKPARRARSVATPAGTQSRPINGWRSPMSASSEN
jgi:hypothetical protein